MPLLTTTSDTSAHLTGVRDKVARSALRTEVTREPIVKSSRRQRGLYKWLRWWSCWRKEQRVRSRLRRWRKWDHYCRQR